MEELYSISNHLSLISNPASVVNSAAYAFCIFPEYVDQHRRLEAKCTEAPPDILQSYASTRARMSPCPLKEDMKPNKRNAEVIL